MAGARDTARGENRAGLGASIDVLGDRGLQHWEERCRALDEGDALPWPHDEARALVGAIVRSLETGDLGTVQATARAWARTSRSLSTLVRQMAVLREVLDSDDVRAIADVDDRLARALELAATTATASALTQLEDAALTDAQTGVGNRRALDAAATAVLASAARARHDVAVVLVDLDGLKTINDTEGHAAGDRAIVGIASALRSALRDSDQVFRIGGDEFVALLPLTTGEAVPATMRRARQLDAPSFSWGAATAPVDGGDLDTLLAKADERLYAARRAARGPSRPRRIPASRSTATTFVAPATGSPPGAGPTVVSSPVERARRIRLAQVVVLVLLLSAILGVALHTLVATASAPTRPAPVSRSVGPGVGRVTAPPTAGEPQAGAPRTMAVAALAASATSVSVGP